MSTVGLQGKVASILSERRLAINLGQRDGVAPGMKFAVLAETPLEIVDPDTQESLGVIEQEKIRVQAVDVQERFSVCATYEKDHFYEDVVARGIDLATFTRPNRGRVPSLPPGESYVKIGDRVRVIEEPAS